MTMIWTPESTAGIDVAITPVFHPTLQYPQSQWRVTPAWLSCRPPRHCCSPSPPSSSSPSSHTWYRPPYILQPHPTAGCAMRGVGSAALEGGRVAGLWSLQHWSLQWAWHAVLWLQWVLQCPSLQRLSAVQPAGHGLLQQGNNHIQRWSR